MLEAMARFKVGRREIVVDDGVAGAYIILGAEGMSLKI